MKVIALAIICIILAASLVGVIAVYAPAGNNSDLKAQIAQKDATIAALQDNLTYYQSINNTNNIQAYIQQIAYLEQQLSSLNDSVANLLLDDQYWQNVSALSLSTTLIYQQQGTIASNSSTDVFSGPTDFAGYIRVQTTSTSTTTYVETIYSSFGVNFAQNITTGSTGTATFPVLPGTLEVKIGNPDAAPITVTATITYYY